MEQNNFLKLTNNKQFDLDALKSKKEIDLSQIKNDKLREWFASQFDKDNSGKIEGSNKDNENELEKLLSHLQEIAKYTEADDDTLIDDKEITKFLADKINTNPDEQVVTNDDFKSFLAEIFKKDESEEVAEDTDIASQAQTDDGEPTLQELMVKSLGDSYLASVKPPMTIETNQKENNTVEACVYDENHNLVRRIEKRVSDDNTVNETFYDYSNGKIAQKTDMLDGNITSVSSFAHLDDKVNITTVKPDGSRSVSLVKTVDETGSFTDADFITRTTTKGEGDAQVTTMVFVDENNNLVEKIQKNDRVIYNSYNGNSISNYDSDRLKEQQKGYKNHNNSLHKQYQVVAYKDGRQESVRYDGKGNTITIAKNGDSINSLKQKFNMSEARLYQLNPSLRRTGVQVAHDIVVENEYNANSGVILKQGTKAQALSDYDRTVTLPRVMQDIGASKVSEVKLDTGFKDVYAYAKHTLLQEGYSGNEKNFKDILNDRANTLIRLNGKSASYKAGASVKTVQRYADKSTASDLKQYGITPDSSNKGFIEGYKNLSNGDRANVQRVMQWCKENNITDENEIKNEIFKKLNINLYESGLTINRNNTRDMLGNSVLLRSGSSHFGQNLPDNIPVEVFVTDVLGLKLDSEEGRNIYGRLVQKSQADLDRISYSQFENMSSTITNNPSSLFNTLADGFRGSGVQIRTQVEQNIEDAKRLQRENTPEGQAKKLRQQSADELYNSIRQALDMINSHIDELKGHMFSNLGEIALNDIKMLSPALSYLADLIGDDSGTAEGLTKSIFKKRAELNDLLIKAIQLKNNANSSDFESLYKEITGVNYNPDNIRAINELRQTASSLTTQEDRENYQDKMQTLIRQTYGSDHTSKASGFISTSQVGGTVIEMAAMVYCTMGMGGAFAGAGEAAAAYTGSTAIGTGVTSALTVGSYTLGRESLNILDDVSDYVKGNGEIGDLLANRGKQVATHTLTSGLFAFVAGASAQKIYSLSQSTQNFVGKQAENISKLFGSSTTSTELATLEASADALSTSFAGVGSGVGETYSISSKAIEAGTKLLEKGATVTGAELVSKASSAVNALGFTGKATSFILETGLFAGVEIGMQTASGIADIIFNDENGFRKAYADGTLEEYIEERVKNAPKDLINTLKEQGVNMLMLKAVSFAVGASVGNNLEGKFETLDNSKVYNEVVNGETKVVVEGTTGKMYCNSMSDALMFLQTMMSAETAYKSQSHQTQPAYEDAIYEEVTGNGQTSLVPTQNYANLPVYTESNLPAGTTIQAGSGLIITKAGMPVGRLSNPSSTPVQNVGTPEGVTTFDSAVDMLKNSNSARVTTDNDGNQVIIYHRNYANLGDYTYLKFNEQGLLVEKGEVSGSKLEESFGKSAEDFEKLNKKTTLTLNSDITGGVATMVGKAIDSGINTVEINVNSSKMQTVSEVKPPLTLETLSENLGLSKQATDDVRKSMDSLEFHPESHDIDTRKLPVLEIVESAYNDIHDLLMYQPDCWKVSIFVRDYLTLPDVELAKIPSEKQATMIKILSNLEPSIKDQCKSAGVDVDSKLKVLKGDLTVEEARNLGFDEKTIELATSEDGVVNKYAVELAQKLSDPSTYSIEDYGIEFILENCDGNYTKAQEVLANIEKDLERNGLKLQNGRIVIDGDTSQMDRKQLQQQYGSDVLKKLENQAYQVSDLLNFYLMDKGHYLSLIENRNFISNIDVSYGIRSITSLYNYKYGLIPETKASALSAIFDTLYHTPTEAQRHALGMYKGDMSPYLQAHANDPTNEDAVALSQYLSEQPLKQDIKVKREDSLSILSNIKINDNLTLEDVLRNPSEYPEIISDAKSLVGSSFVNDRFMSTSVLSQGAFGNQPVTWDFTVKAGVGSAFVDILGLASEGEFLLDKNCKITITDIELSPLGIAEIKATVEPYNPATETSETSEVGVVAEPSSVVEAELQVPEVQTKTSSRENIEFVDNYGEKHDLVFERTQDNNLVMYKILDSNGSEIAEWTGFIREDSIYGQYIDTKKSNLSGLGTYIKSRIYEEAQNLGKDKITITAAFKSHMFHNKMGYKVAFEKGDKKDAKELLERIKVFGKVSELDEKIDLAISSNDITEINKCFNEVFDLANKKGLRSEDIGVASIHIPMEFPVTDEPFKKPIKKIESLSVEDREAMGRDLQETLSNVASIEICDSYFQYIKFNYSQEDQAYFVSILNESLITKGFKYENGERVPLLESDGKSNLAQTVEPSSVVEAELQALDIEFGVKDEYTEMAFSTENPPELADLPQVKKSHSKDEMRELTKDPEILNNDELMNELFAEWKSDMELYRDVRTADEHQRLTAYLSSKYENLAELFINPPAGYEEVSGNVFVEKMYPLSMYQAGIFSRIDNVPGLRNYNKNIDTIATNFEASLKSEENLEVFDAHYQEILTQYAGRDRAKLLDVLNRCVRKTGFKYENGERVPLLTPEEIRNSAQCITETIEPFRPSVVGVFDRMAEATGLPASKTSRRFKGEMPDGTTNMASLISKIERQICKAKGDPLIEASKNLDGSLGITKIPDMFGGRFLPDTDEEMAQIFSAICDAIKTGDFIPTEIENLCGEGIDPYLSEAQMNELNSLCESLGYKDVVLGMDEPGCKTIRLTGYTSVHVNGFIKAVDANGNVQLVPAEFQIRAEDVQTFMDISHLPYDVINGKSVIENKHPESIELLQPFIDEFTRLGQQQNKPELLQFYKYQTACTKAVKDHTPMPSPSEYGLPDIVDYNRIIEVEQKVNEIEARYKEKGE